MHAPMHISTPPGQATRKRSLMALAHAPVPAGAQHHPSSPAGFTTVDCTACRDMVPPRAAKLVSPLAGFELPFVHADLEECFHQYLDYLLFSLADPGYPEKVAADARQHRLYTRAIRRVEEDELAHWRCVNCPSACAAWDRPCSVPHGCVLHNAWPRIEGLLVW